VRTRISPRDLALGLRILATLFQEGLPRSRALAAFSSYVPRGWTAEGLRSIRDSVAQGKSLAAALREAPLEIPPLVIGMIHAGEAGGLLDEAVRRAAEVTERNAATRAAIRGALVYPMILAVAGTLSVALLIGIVLPRFAAIVSELGQTLPASARFVLATGDVVRTAAIPATAVLTLAVLGWRQWIAGNETSRAIWHGMLLSAPLVGSLRRAGATARVASVMSALLRTGVVLPAALALGARAAGDASVAQRLLVARERVIGGERLSAALQATEALTPGTVHLVRAGEATGHLGEMLDRAGQIEGEWAAERVKAMVRVIEPALILVFGAIVAVIAAALLQAVYSVRPIG
jgi:general secretion pathway protein F